MEPASSEIREDVYSRQLYAYGAEAMKNMAGANVLFIGLAALGVEIGYYFICFYRLFLKDFQVRLIKIDLNLN
jgi:hypothetical protein